MTPGLPEWLIIFAVIILLFGGKKLPALGGALGEAIRNFKSGVKDAPKVSEKDPKDNQEKLP